MLFDMLISQVASVTFEVLLEVAFDVVSLGDPLFVVSGEYLTCCLR